MRKLSICMLLFGAFHFATAQTNYYVSADGSDQNIGSLQKPFKTIQKAIRQNISYANKTVKIFLRKGTYYLDSTLVFNSDSLSCKSLTLTAYKNEKVLIAGSAIIHPDWKIYKGEILQAQMRFDDAPDRLFMNGEALPMARYPDYDSAARVFHGTAADAISKAKVKGWSNPAGGYLHALHSGEWGGFHFQITQKTKDDSLLLKGGWQNNRLWPIHDTYRFVENIFEELDAPGEWYYNATEKILYLYPPTSISLDKAVFTISKLTELIVVKGRNIKPVKNITISNLTFAQTARTFMLTKEPLLRSDWTIYRGGAILLDGTENVNINNCEIAQTGGNAVFLSNYNKGVAISNNYIHHIGGSAICFVGSADAVRSPSFKYRDYIEWKEMDYTPGPKTNSYPQRCKAYGNLIHDIGQVEKQTAGVVIDIAEDILVSHNTVYNVPRAGINIGDGCFGGHVIEYNDVFNTVLETGDHGALNSWGRDRFWRRDRVVIDSIVAAKPGIQFLDIVKPNLLYNNRFRCDHGWDIDLDDGSSNYLIKNNVCLSGGIKLREGYNRTVINNIILNNTFYAHVWLANSHDVFKHNLVAEAYNPYGIDSDRWGNNIDSNFFFSTKDLLAVQKLTIDQHSKSGSPDFINSEKGYFITQSPVARAVGFRNFSMSFGVTNRYLRNIAAKPSLLKRKS